MGCTSGEVSDQFLVAPEEEEDVIAEFGKAGVAETDTDSFVGEGRADKRMLGRSEAEDTDRMSSDYTDIAEEGEDTADVIAESS